MSKEQIEEMADKPSLERQRRGEYVRRIVEAVRYKGTDDHEDVWSILYDFEEKITAGYRKQSGWISVEERLPHVSGNYICGVKDKGGNAWTVPADWSHEMKMWFGEFGEIKNMVTHWMPLPEPPKMKGATDERTD